MMKSVSTFPALAISAAILAIHLPVSVTAQMNVVNSHNQVSVTSESSSQRVKTGNESRTELSSDAGSIRVGSSSDIVVGSDGKTIDLRQGVMMVKTTSKGLAGRNSLTVEADQVTATANATMLISYQPRRYIKIACVEGKVTVALKSLSNDKVTIRKGQVLIINCLENILPEAISVDMNRLMQTSPLLAPALRGGPARLAGAPQPPRPVAGPPANQNNAGPANQAPQPPRRGGAGRGGPNPPPARPNDAPGRRFDVPPPGESGSPMRRPPGPPPPSSP